MAYIPQYSNTVRKRNKPDEMEYIPADKVMGAVEKHFEIERENLLKKCRKLNIVYPRQVAIYLLAHYTVLTLRSIGIIFDKDCSTVTHSMEVMDNYIFCDPLVKEQLDQIISTF